MSWFEPVQRHYLLSSIDFDSKHLVSILDNLVGSVIRLLQRLTNCIMSHEDMHTVEKVITNVYISMKVVTIWGCSQLLHSEFQPFDITDWVDAISLTAVEEFHWEPQGGTIHNLCCTAI